MIIDVSSLRTTVRACKSENLSKVCLLSPEAIVKVILPRYQGRGQEEGKSRVQKLYRRPRTRVGCNSSTEEQVEVEDKAKQAHDAAPDSEAAIAESPKKAT